MVDWNTDLEPVALTSRYIYFHIRMRSNNNKHMTPGSDSKNLI